MMRRIYISGKMGGCSEKDIRERFSRGEEYVRNNGCKVLNPARLRWLMRLLPYRVCLAIDLFLMCFCDGIYLLDGWTDSAGASVEHRFACATGMIVYYEK